MPHPGAAIRHPDRQMRGDRRSLRHDYVYPGYEQGTAAARACHGGRLATYRRKSFMRELQTNADAPWKRRFRASTVLWTQIAKAAPTRGLAASDRSGVYQLYAWDVPTGDLRRLTDRREGLLGGVLAPDGRYVYYFDDQQGNEI